MYILIFVYPDQVKGARITRQEEGGARQAAGRVTKRVVFVESR